MRILVPVRYPLTKRSRRTVERALELAGEDEEGDAEMVVLHVNLFQEPGSASRSELRRGVTGEFPELGDATFVVRKGFIVEESILEEAAKREADTIVIGDRRSGKLRRVFNRLVGNNPDIERFLRENLDVSIEVARS